LSHIWNIVESSNDSFISNKEYNINYNNNRNNIINNSSISNISDSENNSIATNNVMNRSIGENHVNISKFLNNECVNIYDIYATLYRLYNFLFGRRDAVIIDLNYKKECNIFI